MKQSKKLISLLLALSFFAVTSAHSDENAVRSILSKSMPSLKIDAIKSSEVKGLYEVTVGSSILYISEDGKYLLQGHLIDIEARKDLTDLKLAGIRKNTLEKLGEDQTITFKAKDDKYNVYVFTDIDCGYCRKLHSEIDQYLAEGISVHYLFFPRAGKGSDSYHKAVTVWCSDDRKSALTAAKKGEKMEQISCKNPVDAHMQLGADFEVRGTPMIVTEKGNVFPGYVPAKRLAQALANE